MNSINSPAGYFLMALSMMGCNVTRQVQIFEGPTKPDQISLDTFNNEVRGHPVTIKFNAEHEYKTASVMLIADSVEYTDSLTSLPRRVSRNDVHYIRRKDRLGGAMDLALLCIPVAIIIGVDKGGVGGETHKGAGIEGALITFGAASFVGFGIGKDYIYELNNPDE